MSEPIREILPEIETAQEPAAPARAEDMPLAWHKALVHCLLWLQMALVLFQAAWIAIGKIYYTNEIKNAVYAGMPGMRILDYALAAALASAAAVLFCARGGLKNRRASGIRLLRAAYILLPAAWLIYGAVRLILAGLSPFSIPVVGQTAVYIALLLINRSYYRKRRSIFSDAA